MGPRFVRLGIAGFKSFADATVLEILPGLSGIVGPNGCGKSNVAEALRWAMGEANARHLRGGEMDDVIFDGTANRASRNVAEVSVTMEAADDGLPAPFDGAAELSIVRRIERGAGSTYRVNGREARARDVQTLFADLSSGARSSAMVSQGRVGALVNARPEERRSVLEEASGITGLHARRGEAEARLRATEANLQRSAERCEELSQQLASLSKQAKDAARYRDLAAGLLEAEALLLAIQRRRAQVAHDAACDAAAEAKAAVELALGQSTITAHALEEQAAALPALRQAEAEAGTGAERAAMALETAGADLARAEAEAQAAVQRTAQHQRDLAHAEAVVGEADAADERLDEEARRLKAAAAAHPGQLHAAQSECQQAADALVAADSAASDAAAQSSAANARSQAVREALGQAESRARRAAEAFARLEADRRAAEARAVDAATLAQAQADQVTSAELSSRCTMAAAEAEQAQAAAAARLAGAREAFARHDAGARRVEAEAAALAEVLAVRDGERWPPLIDSVVVPAGLEAALGAVLGDELGAAANPGAARHWREMPACDAAALPGTGLAGLVSGPSLLNRALGAVGLVRSQAEGDAAQAGLAPGQTIVSAEGAVWRWDGYTVRAGTPTAAAVRLQQRNRLRQLQQDVVAASAARNEARQALQQATENDAQAARAVAQGRQSVTAAHAAKERARAHAHALELQSEGANLRLASIGEQSPEVQLERDASEAALEDARTAIAGQPDATLLKRRADETRADVDLARRRDVAASKALDSLLRQEQARQHRIQTIAREREDRRMRTADLAGRVVDLRARVALGEAEQGRLGLLPGQARVLAERAKARVADLEAARSAARAALQAAESRAAELAAAAKASEQRHHAAREASVRADAAREGAQAAWASTLQRVGEREAALPPLPAVAECSAAAEDRTRALAGRLARERDAIGPVNLRAEIEAAAIGADIATIARERDELTTAIAKLRGSIGHLNREGRERLTAVFEQVDRHFQGLFGRMFGGGRAHLALVGSDDPLLAGLEIYAQPPGKKLATLSLLSGGEQALTALSLIFAVFRCKPAPLCVLDEVDAPLDDANVGRFCALLRDMVQETDTRFLVVTHHQVTMAGMDRLYGVTMQERGVSRLLSVDLSHAVEMTEAVAAE